MSKIDFTKTGTVLVTPASVYYTSAGERHDYNIYCNRERKANRDPLTKEKWLEEVVTKNLVKPVTFIYQTVGWEAAGFSANLIHGKDRDYIDVDIYYHRSCSRVSEFKEHPQFGRGDRYSWRRTYMIRLFKDGTFVMVYSSTVNNRDDSTPFYYIINPKFDPNKAGGNPHRYRSGLEILESQDSNGQPEYIRVYPETDKGDWYEYAMHNSKKQHPLHLFSANDLAGGKCFPVCLEYSGHHSDMQFAKETTKMFEKFYDIEGTGWGLWNQFKARTHNNRTHLADLYDIADYCYGKSGADVNTTYKSLQDRIASWSERIGTLQFDTTKSRSVIWTREGDEIIATLWHTAKDADWNHRGEEFCVFVYNVKTKKRTLVVMPAGGLPSLPIPSEDLVLSTMSNHPTTDYNYDYETRRNQYIKLHEKYPPIFLKPFDEIFKGTNIEVLLKEVDHNKVIYNFEQYSSGYYDRDASDQPLSTVGEQLKPETLNILAFKVLVSSQEPWKEQLIKCHLFNLYFAALQLRDHFVSIKKIEKNGVRYENGLPVNLTAKNLKKCFGMTMAQIQLVDKIVGERYLTQSTEGGKGQVVNSSCVPNLVGMEKDLGVDIAHIDLATFKDLLVLVTTCKNNDYYYRGSNWKWEVSENDLVAKVIANLPLRQKIEVLKGFPNLSQYNDYLRMRGQLQRLSIERSDPTLFSDKMFPVRPSAATRFIRFFRGMRHSWRTLSSEYEFRSYFIENEFRTAVQDKRVRYVYEDDTKVFLGAVITMTLAEHAKFLHDEATAWVELYQDEVKFNEFKRALKRVKDLEYTDGVLSIVAPEAPRDLKAEGQVLNHCVGGFVQPIIDGSTNVVFLRKNKMLGVPFYTIEILNDGTIRQIHCYRNGGTSVEEQERAYLRSQEDGNMIESYAEPVDILKFLKKWAQNRERVKASSIHSSYGMLCAHRG